MHVCERIFHLAVDLIHSAVCRRSASPRPASAVAEKKTEDGELVVNGSKDDVVAQRARSQERQPSPSKDRKHSPSRGPVKSPAEPSRQDRARSRSKERRRSTSRERPEWKPAGKADGASDERSAAKAENGKKTEVHSLRLDWDAYRPSLTWSLLHGGTGEHFLLQMAESTSKKGQIMVDL